MTGSAGGFATSPASLTGLSPSAGPASSAGTPPLASTPPLAGTAGRPPGRRLPRIVLVLGIGLLLAAWVGSNAPGFGPDEPANFIKEIGAGTGQWSGRPGHLPNPTFGSQPGREVRIAWINRNSRAFRLPGGLDPGRAGFPCDLFHNWLPTTCLNRPSPPPPARDHRTYAVSYVGTYEPFVYAVPGAVMARADTALDALYAGRAVTGAIVLALLAVAVGAAWDERAGPLSLTGVLLAVSPMVLFMGSVLGTNGIEISAAAALFTLALRLGRTGPPPRWGWPAAGVVAAVLALSRPTGPAWVLLAPVLGAFFAERRSISRPPRSHRARSDNLSRPRRRRPIVAVGRIIGHRAVPWIGLAAAGIIATVLWERSVQPHPGIRRDIAIQGLRNLPADAHDWVRQWIGVFGWASLPMPPFAYRAWAGGVLVMVAAALVVGTWRHRVRLVGVLVGAAVVAVALDVLVLRQTRFPVFGRYLLPLAVLLPLTVGEILTRRAERIPAAVRRIGAAGVALLAAGVHVVGLWANAQRYAVGTNGPVWFLHRARWLPPGGWSTWLVVAGAGVACLLVFAVAGLVDPGSARRSDPADADILTGGEVRAP